MPTTLPKRADPLRDSRSSFSTLVSLTLVLVLAALLSILMADRFGPSFAADGQSLLANPTEDQALFP